MGIDTDNISLIESRKENVSDFTGGVFENFFIGMTCGIVKICTLGLLGPAMICWRNRWIASHTYINGRQQIFVGKAMDLFGKYLLWALLSVITCFIYAIFIRPVRIKQWLASNTHFVGDEDTKESYFDGSVFGLFGIRFFYRLRYDSNRRLGKMVGGML